MQSLMRSKRGFEDTFRSREGFCLASLSIILCIFVASLSAYKSASAQVVKPSETPSFQQLIPPAEQLSTTLSLIKVASRLNRITGLVPSPINTQEILIVQGSGIIDVFAEGRIRRKNFLDIEDLVSEKNGGALFGVTFSRHFPVTRFGYIGYVDRQGDTVISRVTVGEDGRGSEDSLRVEIKIVQTSQHQRTGALTFGMDDMLYIATGDGGKDAPADSSAQNPQSLLGKILRIAVGREEYTIPSDNPYRDDKTFLPEIFATGLRDPFQLLNREKLYVLDRGRSTSDEINILHGGANYGWPLAEGTIEPPQLDLTKTSLAIPQVNYSRSEGRCLGGSAIVERKERQFLLYGDCKSGKLYAQEVVSGTLSPQITQLGTCNQPISALLVDSNGDLLIGTQLGEIYLATGILR